MTRGEQCHRARRRPAQPSILDHLDAAAIALADAQRDLRRGTEPVA
jgi:hypothetical protein